jgi:EpsG family
MISVQKTENVSQPHGLHLLFTKFNKYIILTFSLFIWSITPIVGVIFILLYCQMNISSYQIKSKNKHFLNIIPLILVVFTISTYIASLEPYGDTEVYISIYKSLKDEATFSIPNIGMEPLSFILPKYLSKLTWGHEQSFLLLQSLTMNIAFTIISTIFIPEFYPLIILINIMSQGYYFQLFWMRQFYSFIFIIPAIYAENFILGWTLIYMGLLTHSSSVIYILPIIFAKINGAIIEVISTIKKIFLIKSKNLNYQFIFILFIILPLTLSNYWIRNFVELVTSLPFIPSFLSQKINLYFGDASIALNEENFTLRNQLRSVFDYLILFIFMMNTNYKKANTIVLKCTFLLLTIFTLYIGSYIFGFNFRVSSIFFCLPGFFYPIVLYSKKLAGRLNIYSYIFFISLVLRIFYFFSAMILSYEEDGYLKFWDGQPLNTPITSYFNFFIQCLEGLFQ